MAEVDVGNDQSRLPRSDTGASRIAEFVGTAVVRPCVSLGALT